MLHNATYLGAEKSQKEPEEYHCEKCDFFTSKLGNWKRHIKTKKHNATEMLHNATDLWEKKSQKEPELSYETYFCDCGKSYKHHSSYYRHKTKCNWIPHIKDKVIENNDNAEEDVVDNSETHGETTPYISFGTKEAFDSFTNIISSNSGNTTTIGGHNNNSFNNNFNINLFLNDKCANALSIQDFAEKLRITMNDLSSMKSNEPQAITNIIEKNLSGLALTERPMHNHEKKWYVKDKEEGWEDKSGEKIVENVKSSIAKKSGPVFVKNNPDWGHSDKKGAEYAEIVSIAMGDMSGNKGDKILKNIEESCSINAVIE
uniref:C2H2-type domain-containing protein n=1 Tax=viral metagenome TaxID=1070528 RepID=A0A6C0LM69_9ZZZZ